jgi:hypothetical protein
MRTVYACTAQSKCVSFSSVRRDSPKILFGKQTSKKEARCRWDTNIKMWQEEADDRVDLIGSELGPMAVL